MTKVLVFKIWIEGLENKIWRTVEITDTKTVADLAYTILSTFDSLAYHLYNIKHNNNRYDCMIESEYYEGREILIDATKTKLNTSNFDEDNKMIMEYDYGAPTTFIIELQSFRNLENGFGRHYPYIVAGEGRGMIDDISSYELKSIIEDIDKKGESNHFFSPGYDRKIKYDYREFDLKDANILLRGIAEEIKYKYESLEEWFEVMKKNKKYLFTL